MFFLGAVGHGRGGGVTKSAAFCNGAGRFVPSNALFWLWKGGEGSKCYKKRCFL